MISFALIYRLHEHLAAENNRSRCAARMLFSRPEMCYHLLPLLEEGNTRVCEGSNVI